MNPFLTHPSVYDTPFSASAIFELFKSYGPTIIIMMIIITFISSFWIKIWFRLAGTASLLKWGKKNKLIDNKWIITSILGCVVMLFLLYYFPAKIDQQNNIFGFISIDKIIKFFR